MSDTSKTNARGAGVVDTGSEGAGALATGDTVSPTAIAGGELSAELPILSAVQGESSAAQSSAVQGVSAAVQGDGGDPLIGRILAERYRVTRLLGSGGMGAVYRAEHVHMRKAVALKVLHREMTAMPEVVARFEREAVAAARIEHPNVAAALDFGQLEDGAFYLVLEYIEGRSLSAALDAEGPFAPLRAVHITRQVAEALAAAHDAGVVHRDLKPDNIMLVERDGDPDFAKVLDFGIAKLRTDEGDGQKALTQIGSVFGTPEYMSPEQAMGEPVDARSDLYALGMILYEMLAGQTAFASGSGELIAVLAKHMTAPPPPLPDHLPKALRDLTMRLLRKEPEARVQTAQELGALLGALELEWSPRRAGSAPDGGFSRRAQGLAGSAGGLGALLGRGVQRTVALARTTGRELPTLLRRKVAVAGRPMPLWSIAVPITALSMVVTLSLTSASARKEEGSLGDRARRLATAVLDPELPALIAKAKSGDRDALAELRRRAESSGSAEQWVALGKGYATIAHHAASVEAYGRAAELEPALREDREVLTAFRVAMEASESSAEAMEIAVRALGSVGADLIDAVVRDGAGDKERAEVVSLGKKLMAEERFRGAASPALLVALELEAAKTCGDYKALIERVLEHGDQRSVRELTPLATTRGCGFLGLRDCYSCLRGKDVPLRAATEAAKGRAAPDLPSADEVARIGADAAPGTSAGTAPGNDDAGAAPRGAAP
ncbi:MAG: serine/threonine protein kinase [Myxococcales bacterium]|nr:serine/threonine protein kinase [Myxococcales bacterium]